MTGELGDAGDAVRRADPYKRLNARDRGGRGAPGRELLADPPTPSTDDRRAMARWGEWASDMSLIRQATISTLLLGVYATVSQLIGLLEVIVLARLLDPIHFGTFAFALFFFEMVQRVRQFGVGYPIIEQDRVSEKDVGTLLGLQVLLNAATLAICLVMSPMLRVRYGGLVTLVFVAIAGCAIFDSLGLGAMPLALLERDMRYREIVIVMLSAKVSGMVVAILTAWAGWGVWALVGEHGMVAVVSLAGYWVCTRTRIPLSWNGPWRQFDWDRAWRFLRSQGMYLWLVGLSWWIINSFGDYLVGSLVGLVTLGYYTRAFRLSIAHLAFLGPLTRVMFPVVSRIRNDPERLRGAYEFSMRVIVRLSILWGLILFVAAEETVLVLLGPKWSPVAGLVRAFVLFQAARPLLDAFGSMLLALNRLRGYAWVSCGAAALVLVGGPMATLADGASGAALAVGVGTLLGAWGLHGMLGPELRRLALPLGSTPVAAAGAALGIHLLAASVWPTSTLAASAVAGRIVLPVTIYCGWLFFTEGSTLLRNLASIRRVILEG